MILLIDNYDSFSYNLYQLIGSINPDIKVIRNDELSVKQIEALNPSCIVLSPGPGRPEEAGICIKAVQYFAAKIPLLGVCLGHQAICEAFNLRVIYAKYLMHGKASLITVDPQSPFFCGLPSRILVARYHSLAADASNVPSCLKVIAASDEGEIMAVKHADFNVYGVQFHPESILTSHGNTIIKNFLSLADIN
ncbi:MAG: aminodeoxychorismate/anthranilate synthase component II [Campylobacteraceae bacterium]|jgi:anthranilate synthase component 2|nr:aminodeoxychorismate/anthranilate synthase component II [Campylobacteraceae bacterium]